MRNVRYHKAEWRQGDVEGENGRKKGEKKGEDSVVCA
jgi:hypothetical protein